MSSQVRAVVARAVHGPRSSRGTGRNLPLVQRSISDRLLRLSEQTFVHTGHGPDTSIGAEAPRLHDRIR